MKFLLLAVFLLGLPSFAAEEKQPPRNIILIAWDITRADRLGAYGYDKGTSPHFDAFARKSVLFEQAISPSSWTLPAAMSVFTGMYPHQHALTNKFKASGTGTDLKLNSISSGTVTIAQILKANGYINAAFTGGGALEGQSGFSRGFDLYVDSVPFNTMDFAAAERWLGTHGKEKFFLFIHGDDTHIYNKLEKNHKFIFMNEEQQKHINEYRSKHRNMVDSGDTPYTPDDKDMASSMYNEQLCASDERLGAFLEFLDENGFAGNTAIIIYSNHGDELFDHGRVNHGQTLYDELLRVPLAIRIPGEKPKRVKDQVGTIGLFPTILDIAGINAPQLEKQLAGKSFYKCIKESCKGQDVFSETEFLFHAAKTSIRKTTGWKFIYDQLNNDRQLFNLLDDPKEQHNLFEQNPQKAYDMEWEIFTMLRQ